MQANVDWVGGEISNGAGWGVVNLEGTMTVEGVDFSTGESVFHYVVGGARHNSLFSGVHLDQEGRIIYGNPFGKLRLDVN